MAQRKFNPARDACSVLWDVLWDDLVTMELAHGKKDQQASSPSRVILYLQMKLDSKETNRVIKCSRGSRSASDIYASIQRALSTYGPNASKVYLLSCTAYVESCLMINLTHFYIFHRICRKEWSRNRMPHIVQLSVLKCFLEKFLVVKDLCQWI